MFPYIVSTAISFGPITIQTWGLFVVFGFLAGAAASAWLAKRRGLKPVVVWDTLGLIIIGAMIGARLFHVIFYEPAYYLANPSEFFAIWHGGLSMMGGLFGAAVAGLGYLKYKKLDLIRYSDVLIFGLPLGYFIGRIGCFMIHDHPGLPTNFFLGVQYPDGIVRHDLGLYHSLLGLAMFLFFLVLQKKYQTRVGIFVVSFFIIYGVARLFLDFLREGDACLWFLTPGQWFGMIMIMVGVFGVSFVLRPQRVP